VDVLLLTMIEFSDSCLGDYSVNLNLSFDEHRVQVLNRLDDKNDPRGQSNR
jgi:hypothetical protein